MMGKGACDISALGCRHSICRVSCGRSRCLASSISMVEAKESRLNADAITDLVSSEPLFWILRFHRNLEGRIMKGEWTSSSYHRWP
jgi:hypothetical protein